MPPVFLSRQSAPIATIAPWKKPASAKQPQAPISGPSRKAQGRRKSEPIGHVQIRQPRRRSRSVEIQLQTRVPTRAPGADGTLLLPANPHAAYAQSWGLFDRPKVRPCPPGRNESHVRSYRRKRLVQQNFELDSQIVRAESHGPEWTFRFSFCLEPTCRFCGRKAGSKKNRPLNGTGGGLICVQGACAPKMISLRL